MGLFKEFKDDFSQAVNELVPGDVPEKEVEPKAQTADNLVVDTIGENVDVASELSKLDDYLSMSRSSHRRQLYQDQLQVKILQSIQSIHKKRSRYHK